MPVADEQQIESAQDGARRWFWPRRWRTRIAAGGAIAALVAGSAAWIDRERIASDFIDDYLATNGVPATYDIIAIGPRMQVIENLVVGDPARPDLTARRMVVELGVGWAGPEVRRVTLDGVRMFGTYQDGAFSLGALDPLLFTDSAELPALPAIDVVVNDARALIESDFGAVGITLDGAGRLDDGFAGTLAATAPGIGVEGCRAERATLYGQLTTASGAPSLSGPLRIGDLACGGASMTRADIGTALSLKRDFTGAEADLVVEGGGIAMAGVSGDALSGTAKINWGESGLAIAHDLALANVNAPQGRLASLSADGAWRGPSDASRGQWEGTLRGAGITPAADLTASLAAAERGLEGTLLAPLIAKARGGVDRALTGSRFSAEAIVRHKRGEIALIVPEAALTSRAGTRVLALSQINAGIAGEGLSGLRGNILAGGEGLPSINGRIEQEPGDRWTLRLAMADYAAGVNRLAIPRLTLRQMRGGVIDFAGLITASGDLPGGGVTDLTLPLEGTWSAQGGLAVGRRCMPVRFGALALSGLRLAGQAITLCPEGGGPMLAYNTDLRLAANTGKLALAGTLGDSPANLAADAVMLRYPSPFAVTALAAQIGAPGSEIRLSAASLTGDLAGEISGEFAGGAAQMEVVPLDIGALAGRWSFSDGVLRVGDGAFTLTDRVVEGEPRFKPLMARGASLLFDGNAITADATLRHPASDKMVTSVAIAHQLDTARGNARLSVPGIVFDKSLQPEDLSYLAKGVIAFADGTVSGNGRIDWIGDDITSNGTFASDGVNFAAAFGPVRGLAGEVRFTDLLNLTTAPDQRVRIAAINPGIEVLGGTVQFEVKDGTLLNLEDARFPFMGGELRMRPLAMDFSQPEERRYVFEIIGLDAATFAAQMELTNLGATGTFDGTVPIVFDTDGNGRIIGGLLVSRAPGGNVAYIGELTYEDLGAMGNYAFSALRSLDYRQMSVGLNGDLAGEIITNFDFDGVRQGEGTSQNFVTRRLAKLPIRFKVNVRSENFYELATMVRSLWDVDFLGNPVDRGLLKAEGGRFVPANPAAKPVQLPESEDQP
ncbi:MAG: exoprotein [Alphaproteobacteria bacterium HGW-Alphaproteobacteria-16]|nr:MAG: exoprotein [Alphaproteobacteria bacterium HGW-Alphaproteobacteria-16]